MKALGAFVTAWTLAACTAGCTIMGCFGQVSIDSVVLGAWLGEEPITVELCVENTCEEQVVDTTSAVITFDVPGPDDLAPGDTVELTLTARGSTATRQADGRIQLEVSSPNGPECGPSCVSGRIEPDGETLVPS